MGVQREKFVSGPLICSIDHRISVNNIHVKALLMHRMDPTFREIDNGDRIHSNSQTKPLYRTGVDL